MLVYEINTRCWLFELSQRLGTPVTLANVPEFEFDRWLRLGFTHLWLMGVWKTGPRSLSVSRRVWDGRQTYAQWLPDLTDEDLTGSPYAVEGYEVPEALGGEAGLRLFRQRLNASDLGLILDFIPNHTGLDKAWLSQAPELFIHSPEQRPGTFHQPTVHGPCWIAHGKDPFFPPWSDTAQLDYRNPATHAAVIEELLSVARRCDGVRCDMAMLLLNDVFSHNWAGFSSSAEPNVSQTEFWATAVASVRSIEPDFLFLAEAYWGLEPRLIQLGFDFAYDKELTDHLVARRPAEVQWHIYEGPLPVTDLGNTMTSQPTRSAEHCSAAFSRQTGDPAQEAVERGTHFLENHDEPRIASRLSIEEHRAAALLILGLPGLALLHEGQLTGATIHASVHLRRRPSESPQPELASFYEHLLFTLQRTAVGRGRSELLKPCPAWEGNPTAQNFVVVQWQSGPSEFDLVVVNLAPHQSQCYVRLSIANLAERNWTMTNLLGTECLERHGAPLRERSLYLNLPAHGAQLFHFS